MTDPQSTLHALVPVPLPASPAQRLLLFAMRRMGGNGLHDAACAQAFLMAFGRDFRRPLTVMRAFMAETARTSRHSITISPPCCRRMTTDEATLVEAVRRAATAPAMSALLIADLLGRREGDGITPIATLLATAFADSGFPLGD